MRVCVYMDFLFLLRVRAFFLEETLFWVLVLLISSLDIYCVQRPIGYPVSVLAVYGQP